MTWGLENLNVKWMMWNHKLARAIWNQWWVWPKQSKLTYKQTGIETKFIQIIRHSTRVNVEI